MLPLAVCVLLVGGGGGGGLTLLTALISSAAVNSRVNFLINSFSLMMISLLTPFSSKSSKKCVQDGSTPVEVKPDFSS